MLVFVMVSLKFVLVLHAIAHNTASSFNTAMNEINASKRMKEAALQRAEV